MAQPHKGAREQILAPVPEAVATLLRQIQVEHAISSASQLAADLLAIAVGHPELVRELDHQQIMRIPAPNLSSTGKSKVRNASRERIKVRVAELVASRLRALAADHATNPSQVTADLLAIAVGHPELVRDLHKEVMPLAM